LSHKFWKFRLHGAFSLAEPNITLYILFNKRRRLASEGLASLARDHMGRELRSTRTTRQDVTTNIRPSNQTAFLEKFRRATNSEQL